MVVQMKLKGQFIGKKYLNHPYTAKVKMVCHNCDISEGASQSWVTMVREGFIKKNIVCMIAPMC